MPQRHGAYDSYRYGFQEQEKDDELKGVGNSLNYTYRIHDPRVGRFFATDPLEIDYPWYTPYQFSGNRVLDKNELEGLETGPSKRGKVEITMTIGRGLVDGFIDHDPNKALGDQSYVLDTGMQKTYTPRIKTSDRVYEDAREFGEILSIWFDLLIPIAGAERAALRPASFRQVSKKTTERAINASRRYVISEAKTAKAFKTTNPNKLTVDELGAVDHAFKRHAGELSDVIGKKIQWTKKAKLEGEIKKFNEAVTTIETKGKYVGKANVPYAKKGQGNGSVSTEVDVYIYNHTNGKTYYSYRRTVDGQFVSAGEKTKKIKLKGN